MEKRKRYLFGDGEVGRLLQTNGQGGTNPYQNREQVVATIQMYNRPGRLKHNYTESKGSTKIRFDLHDGGRVSLTNPINPYTPETFLTTAFDSSQPDILTAQYVYDKSDALQYKYWQITLAQLVALRKQTPIDQTHITPAIDFFNRFRRNKSDRYIFFMENTGPLSFLDDKYRRADLDGFSPRTSRTGADIHLHASVINEKWLQPGVQHLDHLHEERDILRRLTQNGTTANFLQTLSTSLQASLSQEVRQRAQQNLSLVIEEGVPTGYSLVFADLNEKNILKNIAYFSHIMKAHFEAYKKAYPQLFHNQDVAIPQPALRTFGTFEKGKKAKDRTLTITIAPQVLSFAGPLEAAGVELQRSPKIPPLGTEKQRKVYGRRYLWTIQRLTAKDKSYETRRVKKFTEPEWK